MKKIVLVILIVCMGGFAFYFYQKASELKSGSLTVIEKQAREIIARVGKIIMLPEGEMPVVVNLNDPAQFKDVPFFAKAKVGDKALFYQMSKRAYLYDPVANKILEVATISLDAVRTTPKATDTTKKTVK
jgi:hypothetical protein